MTPLLRRLLPFLALASACSGSRGAPEIRIGVLASLTGTRAEVSGIGTREGAEFAARALNDSGGVEIAGQRYHLVPVLVDIGENTDQATSAAQRLINSPDITAIIGPQYSRNAIPVANLAENAGVPMITPMATHPDVTAHKHWVFRICALDEVQARALVQFAVDSLHARTAAVLFDISAAYSRDLASAFERDLVARGGVMLARESYTADAAHTFIPQLQRIRATHPDVVFLPNEVVEDTIQLREARQIGLSMPMLGTDLSTADMVRKEPASEGMYLTHQWSPLLTTPASQRFTTAFRNAYHHEPLSTTATTYDAVMLIADALHRAGKSDAEALRNALSSTRSFPGITGAISYGKGGDPVKNVVVLQVLHRQVVVRGSLGR
ncbi:MAG: Extracellular ligand-binding receptor [Gemmatimonadetes bacterium]|nr:Extracellular ligand-binding receptor [Gemmatimonadota bacterium]